MRVIDQRKNHRFQLKMPLRVLRTSSGPVSHSAWIRNISSSGVLFASDAEVQVGGAIEYVVTLAEADGVHVDLRCFGKVLRLEKSSLAPTSFLVAATVDRYQFVRRES